ncbi:hypothetical protein GCM10022237_25970 [Nocardioides ginsengisoli]|uniref:Uncharacterized protein n=1 Tax=Nocardioides ginsengisoli TaxID=363868 RepID=A0ABW3W5S7_9ACTN
MDRRTLAALSVAGVVGIVAGAGTALGAGHSDQPSAGHHAPAKPRPRALWLTSHELHDGATVVRLEGVAFVTSVVRDGDHWIVQDVPDDPQASPRVLRVDRDGRVVVLAEVEGRGDISADGTQHIGLDKTGKGYQVTDLTTGRATRVPPAPDPGDAEGTALFDGEDVITGWSPTGTTYYRSTRSGEDLAIVGRDVVDGRFSPDRTAYVGLQVGLGRTCVRGGAATEDATLWKDCPAGLATASPYAPDGRRLVTTDTGLKEGWPTKATILDAATGQEKAQIPLPKEVFDVAMLADDEIVALSVTGPDGKQTTTVRTCTVSGGCVVVGRAAGVGILGGGR